MAHKLLQTNPLIPDYRDFVLFVQDFALLFDKNGKPLQPPKFPGSQDDPGLFGVNYKNEPLQFRLGPDCDPAYTFSSYVNGDPITPILRAYEGDPIRIRLLQGAQEESHSFNVHGLRWQKERGDLNSKYGRAAAYRYFRIVYDGNVYSKSWRLFMGVRDRRRFMEWTLGVNSGI